MPLALGQMTVQNRHAILDFGEAALETLDRLRCERNFRHEHDRILSLLQCDLDRLQINFRFAAAGYAMQQNWFGGISVCHRFLHHS